MVAFEESFDAIGGQIEFCVEPFRSVAFAANLRGNFEWRTVLQALDLMFGMAIVADGRIAFAGRCGTAMDARGDIARLLLVTLAAGLSLLREIERRCRRIVRTHLMRIVAILAVRCCSLACFQRQAVNARAVALALPRVAQHAVDGFRSDVVVRVSG